jgi:hypothetical protein
MILARQRGADIDAGAGAMDTDVAASIRDKIRAGILPLPPQAPEKCYVGKGTRRPCDGCDELITPEQIEYELDITDNRTLRFHDKCLTAWHEARAQQMSQ